MAERMGAFISHHHSPYEDAFTQRLRSDLESAGADVWVDYKDVTYANFVQRINEGLAGRQWLILIMTPEALKSSWVADEVNAALNLTHQGLMRGVIPVVARHCDPRDIPPLWSALQRYDATRDYATALAGLVNAMGLTQEESTVSTRHDPVRQKPRRRNRAIIASMGALAMLLVAAIIILQLVGHGLVGGTVGRSPTATATNARPTNTTMATASSTQGTLFSVPSWQSLQGWNADVAANQSWGVSNGNLTNNGNNCCLVVAPYHVTSLADYGVEASMQMVSCASAGGSFGLFGRGTPATTSNGGYAGYVAYWGTSQNLRIRRAPDHDANQWATVNQAGFTLDSSAHLFRLEFRGTLIRLYVGGALQVQATDAAFSQGSVVGIEDNACQINVFSFRVYQLS